MGYDLVLPVTRGCLTEVFFFIGDFERRCPPHRSPFVGLRIRMHAVQDLQENVLSIVTPCTRRKRGAVSCGPIPLVLVVPGEKDFLRCGIELSHDPEQIQIFASEVQPQNFRRMLRISSTACSNRQDVNCFSLSTVDRLLGDMPAYRHLQTFLLVGDVHHIQSLCSTLVLYFHLFC
jgi:hypothetical protein